MRFAGSNPQISSFISADFSPRYDEQADAGMKGRSLERKVGHEAEGFVASSGLDAMAKVQGAHEQARGIVAQGEAQAAASGRVLAAPSSARRPLRRALRRGRPDADALAARGAEERLHGVAEWLLCDGGCGGLLAQRQHRFDGGASERQSRHRLVAQRCRSRAEALEDLGRGADLLAVLVRARLERSRRGAPLPPGQLEELGR